MPVRPDLRALTLAADALDRSAGAVEADAAGVDQLVGGLPWHGPRRDVVGRSVEVATGAARSAPAWALRQLALDVEHELRVLAALADRARRHLEDLFRQAHALVRATADAVADLAAQGVARIAWEVVTLDPAGALAEARALADQAHDRLASVTLRLAALPEPHDVAWRRLGPEILAWRP